jgi:hypothetical protein
MGGGGSKSIIGFFPTEPNLYPKYSNVTVGEHKGFDSRGLTKMKKGDARWTNATAGICTDCKGDCPDEFVSFGHSKPGINTSDNLCHRDWDLNDRKVDCCSGNAMGVSTCPPGYAVGSDICLETMKRHCRPMRDGTFVWDSSCDDYVDKAPPQQSNDLIETAVSGFFKKHSISETPQIPFGKTLQKLCGDRPGLCDDVLRKACKGGTSRDKIMNADGARQEYAQNICGCFLEDTPGFSDYSKYQGQVPKECDPICRASKIQPGHRDGAIWVEDSCKESDCIIDRATLNLIDSASGGMTIQQACGSDGKTALECYLGDIEVDAIESTVGKFNLCQECKGGIKVNPPGQGQGSKSWVDYDCNAKKTSLTEPSGFSDVDFSGIRRAMIWTVIVGVIIIVVIIYLRKRKR